MLFFSSAVFCLKPTFSNNSSGIPWECQLSNSLDPDQARHFVGPDLGPNCFQKLTADETRR